MHLNHHFPYGPLPNDYSLSTRHTLWSTYERSGSEVTFTDGFHYVISATPIPWRWVKYHTRGLWSLLTMPSIEHKEPTTNNDAQSGNYKKFNVCLQKNIKLRTKGTIWNLAFLKKKKTFLVSFCVYPLPLLYELLEIEPHFMNDIYFCSDYHDDMRWTEIIKRHV